MFIFRYLRKSAKAIAKQKNNIFTFRFDSHYFMPDPEEFIYEFFPNEPAWQLLPRPITMSQFERLPFVRSLFFRYGLHFTDPHIQSVVHASASGAATISIGMNREAKNNLIFHYNLRFYDTEETEAKQTFNSLKITFTD